MLGDLLRGVRPILRLLLRGWDDSAGGCGPLDRSPAAADAGRPRLGPRLQRLAGMAAAGSCPRPRPLLPQLQLQTVLFQLPVRTGATGAAGSGRHRGARADRLPLQLRPSLHGLGRQERRLLPRLDLERRRALGLLRRPLADPRLARQPDPLRRRPEAPPEAPGAVAGPQASPNQSLRRKRRSESVPRASRRGISSGLSPRRT